MSEGKAEKRSLSPNILFNAKRLKISIRFVTQLFQVTVASLQRAFRGDGLD